jgi:hypothetical protein
MSVAPVAITRKLRNRHQLDCGNAQSPQLREPGDHRVKSALRSNSADMQLVYDHLLQRDAATLRVTSELALKWFDKAWSLAQAIGDKIRMTELLWRKGQVLYSVLSG